MTDDHKALAVYVAHLEQHLKTLRYELNEARADLRDSKAEQARLKTMGDACIFCHAARIRIGRLVIE
jgi:hypothetical protein